MSLILHHTFGSTCKPRCNGVRLYRQQGFTLIELMIAMTITAVVGGIAAAILTTMINNNEIVQREKKALVTLERALSIIKNDIEHIAFRPKLGTVKDNNTAYQFATNKALLDQAQSISGHYFIEFSRYIQKPMERGIQQSLERVRYQLQDNQIIRESIAVAFPAANQTWQKSVLLSRVDMISVHYLFARWQSSLDQLTPLNPKAIKFSIETQKWSDIELVVALSGMDQS